MPKSKAMPRGLRSRTECLVGRSLDSFSSFAIGAVLRFNASPSPFGVASSPSLLAVQRVFDSYALEGASLVDALHAKEAVVLDEAAVRGWVDALRAAVTRDANKKDALAYLSRVLQAEGVG